MSMMRCGWTCARSYFLAAAFFAVFFAGVFLAAFMATVSFGAKIEPDEVFCAV